MTNAEKLKAARDHFMALGMSPNIGAPPIVRLFWLVGIPVPPLVFLRFGTVALITGTFFAAFWGYFMWIVFWSGPNTSRWIAFGVPALAGAAFGLYNAWRMRAVAQKLNLPLWAQYNGEPLMAHSETTQPDMGLTVRPSIERQAKFTRTATCPHCGCRIRLGLSSFIPWPFVGPRITCPHCRKRCTLQLWLRFSASLSGFLVCMSITILLAALMIIKNVDSQVLIFISVIMSVLTWMAVEMFICFKYGVLVKSKF